MPEASAAEPWHGTPGGYTNRKCREDCCREAHRIDTARMRKGRIARGLADPSLIPHGTDNGYTNWYCRCIPCGTAHYDQSLKYKESKA